MLSAMGSTNCFSYLSSPDVIIEDDMLYRSLWQIGSSCTGVDSAVQFRLRINQKGSWQSWNHTVNSNLAQGPSAGNPKVYNLFFNPIVTGSDDDRVVMSFDIMSFDWFDDMSSWLYLEEVIVMKTAISSSDEILRYEFTGSSDGWTYQGQIPSYDEPLTSDLAGNLGLMPDGSSNCFSYWFSPDVTIEAGMIYRTRFTVGSTSTEPDQSIQTRLRINQKGAWQGWDRIVNSNKQQAPSATEMKTYDVFFMPIVTGSGDNLAVFSFDIMSFDWFDNLYSWIYLDTCTQDEISFSPF